MSKQLQTIHLDPFQHADSVSEFFKYFRLPNRKAQISHLQQILEYFARIPYENISKIIKLNQNWRNDNGKIRLPDEVIEGHISSGLGGTCFSLTFYLQSILGQAGYTCYPVMADMRAGDNIHCCLIVVINEQKYLVDPGYLLTQPMELNPQKPKMFRTEFSGVHLQYDKQRRIYNLYTFDKNETKWRYRFRDRKIPADEFLLHWQASFQWNSMHALCLTKVMDNGLLYFRKDFMRETTFHGKKNFNVKKNSPFVIRERFGINEQIVEQAQVALQENLQMEKRLGLWVPRKMSSRKSRQCKIQI